MAEPENMVLRELRAMRKENDALRESVTRVVELVGRINEGIANVRADIAGVRTDLARVQGDVVLLENQNMSRHGEIVNLVRRLDPVEQLAREFAATMAGETFHGLSIDEIVERAREMAVRRASEIHEEPQGRS